MNHGIGNHYGKAGFVLFFLFACTAVVFWAPNASAQSTYYTSRGCSGCHGTTPTTCNGCHEHGVRGRGGTPQSASVNKTSFAPGENIIVTLSGGRTSGATNGGGWVRGILYRDNVEIARSTGTGSPPRGGSGLPITFTTPAPTTPGTYTYAAAWFGNTSNNGLTGNVHGEVRAPAMTITVAAATTAGPLTVSAGALTSSGTAGGPFTPSSQSYTLTNTGTASMNWTASKVASWVTLSAAGGTLAAGGTATVTATINSGANSLTAGSYSDTVTFANTTNGTGNTTRAVSLTVNAAAVTLSSIAITGAASVNEGSTAQYAATATWSDGTTTNITSLATWSANLGTISAAGLFSAPSVTANQTATLGASYTSGGTTRTTSVSVTVANVTATTGAVTITPSDGATEVLVNSVITARVASGDIRTLFNRDTFTLRPSAATVVVNNDDGDDDDESEERRGALASTYCVRDGVVQGWISYNDSHTRARFTPNCSLKYNMTYIGEIASGGESLSVASQTFRFTTAVERPDSDDDGGDDEEDDRPYDRRRTGRWSSYGTGKFRIQSWDYSGSTSASVTATSGPTISGTMAISETSSRLNQDGKPEGYEFPDGLVFFQADNVAPGTSATFKVTFPSGIAPGSKVYQVDTGGFHEVTGAVVEGDTVTMTVSNTDGEAGVITNPIGVAVPTATGTGAIDLASGAGGGCSVAGRTGSGGSNIDVALILAGLGLSVWGIRIRRRRE